MRRRKPEHGSVLLYVWLQPFAADKHIRKKCAREIPVIDIGILIFCYEGNKSRFVSQNSVLWFHSNGCVCVYWWYGASMLRLYQCAHLWHAHTMNYTFIYLSFFFFVASFGAMREIRFACDTCTTDEEFELRAYFFHWTDLILHNFFHIIFFFVLNGKKRGKHAWQGIAGSFA